MKVWIVECGDCEGAAVVGLFKHEGDAVDCALTLPTLCGEEWKPYRNKKYNWTSDGEYVTVKEMEVQE